MKNVATNKNKIFGVYTLLFAFIAFTPLIAHGATYSRNPSGNDSYSTVNFSYTIDESDWSNFLGENSDVSSTWNYCNIELGQLLGGSMTISNSGATFGVGTYTGNINWSSEEESIAIGDVKFQCYNSEDEENTMRDIEIEESTGYALFTLSPTSENTNIYGTMFGQGSGETLVANTSSFMTHSGVMPIAITFIAIILGFYIFELLISILMKNKEINAKIKEEFPHATREERRLIKKERKYTERFSKIMKGPDKISVDD